MMKKLNLLLLALIFTLPLLAQRDLSGGKFLTEIDKNGWNKEEMLSFYEQHFKTLAQNELADFTVTSVKIDRKTGAVSVIGKNASNRAETLSSLELGRRSANNGNSDKSIGSWLYCWYLTITLRTCPPDEQEYVPPRETPEAAEMRRRTNLMLE